MTKTIATLISGAYFFKDGIVPVSTFQMGALMTFLTESYSKACAEYVRSAFDREGDTWFAHMDPGEAILDWIASPTVLQPRTRH